ncbi:MAG: methyltransferase [Sediminibacterium sp.]|nr:methyltransferase [Sediminibacterium sp.]
MANTFFQFKKFIVHQAHTLMKVCTDACLFGAWAAHDQELINAKSILDIGTGTGLLSLLLAQANNNAIITAVEIEPAAAIEAASNFKLSPWADQLNLVHDDIQNFGNHANTVYDIIITNPPFYEGDLKSPDENKNTAAHSTALPWKLLIENATKLLSEGGNFYVLVPTLRAYTMQKLCDNYGLQLVAEVLVHNTAKNLPIRAMQKFVKQHAGQMDTEKTNDIPQVKRTKIFIKDADNNYSPEFNVLLKDYYLHL